MGKVIVFLETELISLNQDIFYWQKRLSQEGIRKRNEYLIGKINTAKEFMDELEIAIEKLKNG